MDLNLLCDDVTCKVTERCVDLFTAVLSVSNNNSRDSDSGLGVSADVIVFGKEIENIGRSKLDCCMKSGLFHELLRFVLEKTE